MNYSTSETKLPLLAFRTTNEQPEANQLHMLEQLEAYDVRSIMVGTQGVDVATGEILPSDGIHFEVGKSRVGYGETADVLRIAKRLPTSLRKNEQDIPHVNRDQAIHSTVDKLEMSKLYGELAIPTRLLTGKSIPAERSRSLLMQSADEWGTLVMKPRFGKMGEGVAVGTADDLQPMLDTLIESETAPNYIVQPYLDSRTARKPYLPEEFQNRPSSLRIVAGIVQLPGLAPVPEIFTAFYRYGQTDDDTYHDGHSDKNFYLQQEGASIEETHPELVACFELVKEALVRGSLNAHSKDHGVNAQICSNDLLLLPEDAALGYTPNDGNHYGYKPIIMEQNSSTSRFDAGKHDPTRDAWHRTEARLLGSIAHRQILGGIR